jgi:hypothetical protein
MFDSRPACLGGSAELLRADAGAHLHVEEEGVGAGHLESHAYRRHPSFAALRNFQTQLENK